MRNVVGDTQLDIQETFDDRSRVMLQGVIPLVTIGREPGVGRREGIALAIIIDLVEIGQAVRAGKNIGLQTANPKGKGERRQENHRWQ